MRIYVPTTLAGLAGFVADGRVPDDAGCFFAPDEDEESEYAALQAAADAAADLLDGPGRRVVVVAEVADSEAGFGMDHVVSVHADTGDIDPVDEDLPDLAWFATQEIPDLLG